MIVAIMQPYFFPYVGYFQLMHAVDVFVFYDDTQYRKGGWINRNRVLRDGHAAWWTFPIVRDDYRLSIRERRYSNNDDDSRGLLDKLDNAYRSAPFFASTRAMVARHLASDERRVAAFNRSHLVEIGEQLGVTCRFLTSSQIEQDRSLHGQERVIDICRRLGARQYVNPIGGRSLYNAGAFSAEGIELSFLEARPATYEQFGSEHVPFLSIVDEFMFNTPTQIRQRLSQYHLLSGEAVTS